MFLPDLNILIILTYSFRFITEYVTIGDTDLLYIFPRILEVVEFIPNIALSIFPLPKSKNLEKC